MGKPIVVVLKKSYQSLRKKTFSFASKEELQIASKEESSLYLASKEESNKGSTPVVVVPMGFGFIPSVVKTIPSVVVPTRKNDGMGHQSSVVANSPQPRSIYPFADALSNGVVNPLRKKSNQFADVSNNGVTNFNSPDQRPESIYFYQHHQDPPRPTTKLYGQKKECCSRVNYKRTS